MRSLPEEEPSWTTPNHEHVPSISEMDGLINLGMKDEALRRARLNLKQNTVTAKALNEALEAIQTLADKTKPWAKLVESAYQRLPKRERPAVRFLVMSFRNSCHDHEGVLRLIPKRFTGESGLAELVYAAEAAFELGSTELMDKLLNRLPRAIGEANKPVIQSKLLLCLAEFLARSGKWDETISVLEAAQSEKTFSQNAVRGIVEVHAVRALLALRHGFQLIEEFNRSFDPKIELTLPGNDKAIQEQAAKEFRRLQKILERIVPEKRRKQLGIDHTWSRS